MCGHYFFNISFDIFIRIVKYLFDEHTQNTLKNHNYERKHKEMHSTKYHPSKIRNMKQLRK